MTASGQGLAVAGSRGAATTLGYQIVGQVITVGATAVVARKLGPAPYGLLGLALLVGLPLVGLVDLGLGQALTRAPELPEGALDSVFWVTVGGLAVGVCLAVPGGYLIAQQFGVSSSGAVVAVGAVGALLAVPAAAPRAKLARAFRFGRLAATDFLGQILAGGTMLGLALAGTGAWALAAGLGVRSLGVLLSAAFLARFVPKPRVNRSVLRRLLPFGLRTAGSGTLSYVARNIDDLLVARFLGPLALGLYRTAFGIALLPFSYLGIAIANVGLPTFGALTGEPVRARDGYLRALRVLSYLSAGIAIALWWLADDAVRLPYGTKFLGSIPLLRILCVAALLYPLGALSGSVMLALGRADLELKLTALRAVSTGFFAYAGWRLDGVRGIAWGVSAYAVVLALLDVAVAAWLVQTGARALLGRSPGAIVGAAVFAPLLLVDVAVSPSTLARIPIALGAGCAFLAGAAFVNLSLLRELTSRRPTASFPAAMSRRSSFDWERHWAGTRADSLPLDAQATPLQREAAALVERWLPKRTRTILDVGAGTGVVACLLARGLPQAEFVGIDASLTSCEEAAHRVAAAGLANVRFQAAHAESLPFPDDSFDCVYSDDVAQYAPRGRGERTVVCELARVLRHGGRLIVAVPNASNPVLSATVLAVGDRHGSRRLYTRRRLARIAAAAGLEPVGWDGYAPAYPVQRLGYFYLRRFGAAGVAVRVAAPRPRMPRRLRCFGFEPSRGVSRSA